STPLTSLSLPCPHRALSSFPTRRSSDLPDFSVHTSPTFPTFQTFQTFPTFQPFPPFPPFKKPYVCSHNSDINDMRTNIRFFERRSEEHTSELQSRENLVCRLLLEKKQHI